MKKKELNFQNEVAVLSIYNLFSLAKSGVGALIAFMRKSDCETFDDFMKYLESHDIRDEEDFREYVARLDQINEELEKIEF